MPEPEDEAIRDLSRARSDVLRARQKVRQQLRALLLRNGKRYPRKCAWTLAHRRWLCDLRLDHPAQKIALEEYLGTIDELTRRIERLEGALAEQAGACRMAPVVAALQALRGVKLVTAITLITELGDLARFDRPRQLMAFLGLVPSEHSSGGKRRLGAITKCGNTHARKALVEAAWAYRHPARIGRRLQVRSEALPTEIREIAWKAQLRLSARYRKLALRAKPTQLIITALAREHPKPQSLNSLTRSPGASHGPENPRKSVTGRHSSPCPFLGRGSSETYHGLAVTNPRISAGATVVSSRLASRRPCEGVQS